MIIPSIFETSTDLTRQNMQMFNVITGITVSPASGLGRRCTRSHNGEP